MTKEFILKSIAEIIFNCCDKVDHQCEDCLLNQLKMSDGTDFCDELDEMIGIVNAD